MLREATMRGLEMACSRLPPRGDSTKGPVLDRDLLSKVVGKVECFCADAAADEQVAGRELASGLRLSGDDVKTLQGVLHQGLPNLKVAVGGLPRVSWRFACNQFGSRSLV